MKNMLFFLLGSLNLMAMEFPSTTECLACGAGVLVTAALFVKSKRDFLKEEQDKKTEAARQRWALVRKEVKGFQKQISDFDKAKTVEDMEKAFQNTSYFAACILQQQGKLRYFEM